MRELSFSQNGMLSICSEVHKHKKVIDFPKWQASDEIKTLIG
jgi:hypothetical protein